MDRRTAHYGRTASAVLLPGLTRSVFLLPIGLPTATQCRGSRRTLGGVCLYVLVCVCVCVCVCVYTCLCVCVIRWTGGLQSPSLAWIPVVCVCVCVCVCMYVYGYVYVHVCVVRTNHSSTYHATLPPSLSLASILHHRKPYPLSLSLSLSLVSLSLSLHTQPHTPPSVTTYR